MDSLNLVARISFSAHHVLMGNPLSPNPSPSIFPSPRRITLVNLHDQLLKSLLNPFPSLRAGSSGEGKAELGSHFRVLEHGD